MKYIILLIFLTMTVCQKNTVQNEAAQKTPTPANTKPQIENEDKPQVYEYEPEQFTDELRIGKRRLNRVEISTYKKDKRLFVKTKFYEKLKSRWVQKNDLEIEKFGELPIEPEIKDFNGDGFNDLTFVSDSPARGANEVRELFIYESRKNELIHIKNSSDYPNLGYNPLLRCLDAWIFTGSTTTVFLKLKGDKLIEFASVDDRGIDRTIFLRDSNGRNRVLRREKRKDDGFDRYINYNPIQKYQ